MNPSSSYLLDGTTKKPGTHLDGFRDEGCDGGAGLEKIRMVANFSELHQNVDHRLERKWVNSVKLLVRLTSGFGPWLGLRVSYS